MTDTYWTDEDEIHDRVADAQARLDEADDALTMRHAARDSIAAKSQLLRLVADAVSGTIDANMFADRVRGGINK